MIIIYDKKNNKQEKIQTRIKRKIINFKNYFIEINN